jgi:hypothetical protein
MKLHKFFRTATIAALAIATAVHPKGRQVRVVGGERS